MRYTPPQPHLSSTDPVFLHLAPSNMSDPGAFPILYDLAAYPPIPGPHAVHRLRTVACLWSCGIDNLATVGDCLLHFTLRNTSSNEVPEGELSDGVRAPLPPTVSCLPKAHQLAAEPLTMAPRGTCLDSNTSGAIESAKLPQDTLARSPGCHH